MSPLFFDTKSSKFCTVARGNSNLLYLNSDDHSKFPEAYPDRDPLYAGFLDEGMWEGGKGYVVMQNKDAAQARSILHFDLTVWYIMIRLSSKTELQPSMRFRWKAS